MILSLLSSNKKWLAGWLLILALVTSGFGSVSAGSMQAGLVPPALNSTELAPLHYIIAVSAGDEFTCTLMVGGGVRCWGENGNGQLGNGSLAPSATPVDVSGLASGVQAIAAGEAHACAITSAGGVMCWGVNGNGELGDGTTTDRHTPVSVSGLTKGVIAIAVSEYHSCALTKGGGVKCWGDNGNGQLGDNTTTERYRPVNVSGLASGVIAITAGGETTCALTKGGAVKCWGENESGQVGDGTNTDRHTPVSVSGLGSGVSAVSAGYNHACALTTGGAVTCWGGNTYGQLGDGTNNDSNVPLELGGTVGSDISAVSAGTEHTCAVTTSGGVKCWGFNDAGQLGNGTTTDSNVPVDVSGLSDASAVSAGGYHSCVLTMESGVKCWGSNDMGQLGDGTPAWRSEAVDVSGLTSGAGGITAGWVHTCALTTGSGVMCWGWNYYGQLGDGSTTTRTAPVAVSGLSGVSAVAAGEAHTCAIVSGGVKCWGWNGTGQLGNNSTTDSTAPVDVSGLTSGVSAIASGSEHTCALTTGGGVKCWGWNYYGQLGDSTTTSRHTPVDVSGLTSGVVAIAAGAYHTCALVTGGAVKCWGQNYNGQLGNGTMNQTANPTPVAVSGLSSGVSAIALGGYDSCALTTGGGMKCWGMNGFGQLGDNTTTDRTTPVDVSGLTSGVSAIAPGYDHTCALTTGGGVKCWGNNVYGQVGDGTQTERLTPVDGSGLTNGISAVASGAEHSCALTTGGGVKCWGWNGDGQLGDGTLNHRTTPVEAIDPNPLPSLPGVPVLVAPAINAMVTTYTPTLAWEPAIYADHYQVQVATDSLFGTPEINEPDIIPSEFTPLSDLASNTTYFWRVSTYNFYGIASAWSTVRNFRTALPAPISLDADGSAQDLRPSFSWSMPTYPGLLATSFTLQISKNSTFSPLLQKAKVTGMNYFASADLPRSLTLYWRVCANGANGPSAWSTGTYTSGNPPTIPVLTAPANKATITGYTPSLTWKQPTFPAGTFFMSYRVEVATDAAFSSIVRNATITTDLTAHSWVVDPALETTTKYYWHVQACNTANECSTWSKARTFRTK